MNSLKITASIQVLPLKCEKEISDVVKSVIGLIKDSGLSYEIGAHATVVEGKFDEIMNLVERIYDYCKENMDRVVLNVQFDIKREGVSIKEKVEKVKGV